MNMTPQHWADVADNPLQIMPPFAEQVVAYNPEQIVPPIPEQIVPKYKQK
jgi:hypothetical protein